LEKTKITGNDGNHLGTNQIQIQETFQFLLKKDGSKSPTGTIMGSPHHVRSSDLVMISFKGILRDKKSQTKKEIFFILLSNVTLS